MSQSLYHSLCAELADQAGTVRRWSRERLALLVTGVITAQSCVIADVARSLDDTGVTAASEESTARRLRRTMNDPHRSAAACSAPLIASTVDAALLAGSVDPILL